MRVHAVERPRPRAPGLARVAALAALVCSLATISGSVAQAPSIPAAAPYNFTVFETQVFPKWLASFALPSGSSQGNYSYQPGDSAASVYAAADVAHAAFALGQLTTSAADLAAWAAHINSFQNATGFYAIQPDVHAGFNPWHITGYATAALKLLGHAPRYDNAEYLRVATTPSTWNATFLPLLSAAPEAGGCSSIWDCGHKIAAIPATLAMTHGVDTPELKPFFTWWVEFLNGNIDSSLGLWCAKAKWAPPAPYALGGSFHMYFVYTWLGAEFPHPTATMETALAMQHNASGLWGSGTPQYIDLDGMYQVVRPANQMGIVHSDPRMRQACDRLLATAAAVLNDESKVVGAKSALGGNAHNLPGALGPVAECAKWFPELVATVRPWRQTLDYAPYV